MARDPFANYDAWLEAPIQRQYEYADKQEALIDQLGLTEEEAEKFDFEAYFAEQDEAQYAEYKELAEDIPDWWDEDPRDRGTATD